jgi:hypothetical protein
VKKSVAIIFHENERKRNLRRYGIWYLTEFWREDNINVVFVFGVDQFIPADLAILHVDLTVVPERYLEFAQRYPVVLNGRIKDIRKSSFSKHLVHWGDSYEGKVIVKSDLNYAGTPERRLCGTLLSRPVLWIKHQLLRYPPMFGGRGPFFRSPLDYLIYDHPQSVPRDWFNRKDIIIERFLPEEEDGLYCSRIYHFLGDHGVCLLRKSTHPISSASMMISREVVEPHAEIVELTKHMKFDYGKFDYVLYEGNPVLLDINKTPGASTTSRYLTLCREWAKGIRSYL